MSTLFRASEFEDNLEKEESEGGHVTLCSVRNDKNLLIANTERLCSNVVRREERPRYMAKL